MPSRKLEYKSSHREDRKPEVYRQTEFLDAYEDIPPTEVRDNYVAKYLNTYGAGTGVKPRNGTFRFTDSKFPAMGLYTLRTGYNLTKNGRQVTSNSGDVWTEDDVGNLIGWDNGLYDEIVRFRTPQEVWVRDNDPQTGTNCHMRGKLNLWYWHNAKQIALVQLAQDFYLVNRAHTVYTHVPVISSERPSNGISTCIEYEDYFIVNNSTGMYRIIIDEDPPLAYKLNMAIPATRITSNDDEGEKVCQYRYFFSMARLARGTNFRNRETPVAIMTESGINAYDEDRRDWALINTEDPIGDGLRTYGVLEGGDLGARTNPAAWVENDGTFRIGVNGLPQQNILCDFTGVVDMLDVANVIQTSMRLHFPSATCEYLGDRANPCFRITSGRVPDGDVTTVRTGIGGTNIAAVMQCRGGDGALVTNPPVTLPHVVRGINIPEVPYTTTDEREWPWTHMCVYRTGNTKGTHKNVKGNEVANSQDDVVWAKDLRVAGAFYARIVDGYIEARYGEFERADVGSVVEFDDGSRIEIAEYINSQLVRFNDDYYYDYGVTGWMAACIGNGRVMRASQSGHTVTRTEGGVFSSADERKPVWWPDGSQGVVRAVIDQNTAVMWDETDRNLTGMTINPTYRNFNDTLDDDSLYNHSSAWKCRNRFMKPIPRANMVSLQPGFILSAVRGGNRIYYCMLEASYRPYLGYAVIEYQRIELEDQCLELVGFPLQFSALCQSSTWTGITNNAQLITLPETNQLIPVIESLDKIANVGISNWGSVQFIEDDLIRFVTNTNEIRDFNGREFGPDLTSDPQTGESKIQRAIKGSWPQYTSMYTRETGYILWWRNR